MQISAHSGPFSYICASLLLAFSAGRVTHASGLEPPTGNWSQSSFTEPVAQLFAPSSGALLARTETGLHRSDDGGAVWREITLPSPEAIVRVDPANHDRLLALDDQTPYLSEDGGATWSEGTSLPSHTRDAALSAADPTLVIVATAPRWPEEGSFRLLRSRDRLQTWEAMKENRQSSRCGWTVFLLETHRINPSRLFLSAECAFGGLTNAPVQQSLDAGAAWSAAFTGKTEYPRQIITGAGGDPGRIWLSTTRDTRSGGSELYRSNDDGQTWQPMLGETLPNDVEIVGLTANPQHADHVCFAANTLERTTGAPRAKTLASNVRCSMDAGSTWLSFNLPDGSITQDLAIGIDGANLFAATSSGVWILPLAR